jgi:hypothetical protein
MSSPPRRHFNGLDTPQFSSFILEFNILTVKGMKIYGYYSDF